MYRNLFLWNFNDFYKNLKILTSGFSIRTLSRSHMPFFLQSAEIKIVPSQAAARLGIFTRDFPTGMLTVEIKWCPNLIIFDDYILLEASLPLPGASQTFLCRELTGALLEPNICASHSPVSLLHETLNPDNQPKHIQAFILKIPTAKTRGVLTVHKGWNWRLWTCSTNAAGKNNTHLRSGEIQGHSWCDEALWFSSVLNNRGNMTSAVPPLAWVVLCARPEW